MNIVLFGSPDFAVPSLKALFTTQHKILCVVTQPDRPWGRGLHWSGTTIKRVAESANLRIYQPVRINLPEAIKLLKNLDPDLFIVIAYGQILSKQILDIPRIFCVNLHASLLPKYRGAAPINWAIINGEKITGVTVIKLIEKMDAGPIIMQKRVDIYEEDTSISLQEKLSHIAAQLLLDSLKAIGNNTFTLTDQDENQVSFAPRLKKQDGLINWNNSATNIYNQIRGCMDWPGTFTYYKGRLLKIYKAKVIRLSGDQVIRDPGEIIRVSKEGIAVACAKDSLIIQELQIEGKRKMKVVEFIAGHRVCVGENLGRFGIKKFV